MDSTVFTTYLCLGVSIYGHHIGRQMDERTTVEYFLIPAMSPYVLQNLRVGESLFPDLYYIQESTVTRR